MGAIRTTLWSVFGKVIPTAPNLLPTPVAQWHDGIVSFDAAAINAEAVLESTATAVVAVDSELRVIMWNTAAERLFGWRAEELIGSHAPIVPGELVAEEHAVLERTRSGSPVSLLSRRRCRDGDLVDVRVETTCLRREGEVRGWVSLFHRVEDDATVQNHMSERARLVRRLTDVVADIKADLEVSQVLDRIARSLTELTNADAGGFVLIEDEQARLVSVTNLSETLRGFASPLNASLFGELLRSGKTVMLATNDSRELDNLIWAELDDLHTIAIGLSQVNGKPYGALYALYSQRRVGHLELELLELFAAQAGVALSNAMAYEQIKRQRSHERAIVDASADGIAVLDPNGVVRKWNQAAAELTGHGSAEIVGHRLPFPLPTVRGRTLTHRMDNGRWLEILSKPVPESGERVVDFRDVSQAKQLEEDKDLFLATTSHELRTPITVIKGFATTLQQRWDSLDDDAKRTAVARIAERAGTLAGLVENLMIGSHTRGGELTISSAPFDLNELLRTTTDTFDPLSDRHRVVLDVPDPLPQVLGDATVTDVILGQLLENAVKYSPDGGTVTVHGRFADDSVVITVEDEGIGIPEADQERVFDRFVQGETGDRRRFGGIGLGLYIVRRLARAQGGDVAARSRSPREDDRPPGTRMLLTLRRADRKATDDSDGERPRVATATATVELEAGREPADEVVDAAGATRAGAPEAAAEAAPENARIPP